jgi:hypothetical protein
MIFETVIIERDYTEKIIELADQAFEQGFAVQVTWDEITSLPAGTFTVVRRDKDSDVWTEIQPLSANMFNLSTLSGSIYSGSVILEEMVYTRGVIGLKYERGSETDGVINVYLLS